MNKLLCIIIITSVISANSQKLNYNNVLGSYIKVQNKLNIESVIKKANKKQIEVSLKISDSINNVFYKNDNLILMYVEDIFGAEDPNYNNDDPLINYSGIVYKKTINPNIEILITIDIDYYFRIGIHLFKNDSLIYFDCIKKLGSKL